MRCAEAREKLKALAGDVMAANDDESLREHVDQCPDCARFALAEQVLTGDLKQLREVRPAGAMTITQVREGIAIRERRNRHTNWGVRLMKQASDTIYRRPRLSLATAAVSILLLASVLVPVGTGQSVRYEVAFAAPADGLVLNEVNAEMMLAALDMRDVRVSVHASDSGDEYKIAPIKDPDQARRLIAMLDSLGGVEACQTTTTVPGERRTIWQLLLDNGEPVTSSSRPTLDISVGGFEGLPRNNFALWMPIGDQSDDTLSGILMDRQGERTNMMLVGLDLEPDERGWNQLLSGYSVLNTETPDGKRIELDLTRIEDVRKLEEMGYNFWTMEFDTPGQIPIPGMGPKLNKIEPNPFNDETTIEYMVPRAYEITLQILDKQENTVRTLQNCIVVAGIFEVIWMGDDADGNRVEPGTYLCRFTAGEYTETQEIVLAR
jgi:hypothetical protein